MLPADRLKIGVTQANRQAPANQTLRTQLVTQAFSKGAELGFEEQRVCAILIKGSFGRDGLLFAVRENRLMIHPPGFLPKCHTVLSKKPNQVLAGNFLQLMNPAQTQLFQLRGPNRAHHRDFSDRERSQKPSLVPVPNTILVIRLGLTGRHLGNSFVHRKTQRRRKTCFTGDAAAQLRSQAQTTQILVHSTQISVKFIHRSLLYNGQCLLNQRGNHPAVFPVLLGMTPYQNSLGA